MKSTIGKKRRLSRIFNKSSGNTIIVPLDDSLLTGPVLGLLNLESKIQKIIRGNPNAVLAFRGQFLNYGDLFSDVGGILNISASTIRSNYPRKVLVGKVEDAISLGLEAVAVHVNVSSSYEYDMLRDLGKISIECDLMGMPLVAIMYVRTENRDNSSSPCYEYEDIKISNRDKYTELICHAVRIGVELGADIVKTQYTGTKETFQKVVQAAHPIPVVSAGGPPIEITQVLENAESIISAGGRGLSFARNIFSRKNPEPLLKTLSEIVHNKLTVTEALKRTGFKLNYPDNNVEF